MVNKPETDELTALKEFLLDIDCLDPLYEWTGKFNLFDILKISRTEIRHSNVLAWLMDPNENHGLGDGVLRGFIQYVVKTFLNEGDSFDVLLMNYHEFFIQREWQNIDILAVSNEAKFLLCIENKIDTGEHDNQLNRYRSLLEKTYPGYQMMFVYLSPDSRDASDVAHWYAMGYQDVLDIVEKARHRVKLLPEAELLIQNYVDTIRRNIVGDKEIARICAEIYAKHQKALDLIFENRPDYAANIAAIFKAWAKKKEEDGEIIFDEKSSVKTYIRFKTKEMSELIPDAEEAISGWGVHNYYFYEIKNPDGFSVSMQLAMSSKDIPDDLRAISDRINAIYPSRMQKQNWLWRTFFSTKKTNLAENLPEEKVCEILDKHLAEIKAFEKKLFKQLEE